MSKESSQRDKDEQELADQIKPLLEERLALEMKRGNGVTLEKGEYIGDRQKEIEKELAQLKTKKSADNNT